MKDNKGFNYREWEDRFLFGVFNFIWKMVVVIFFAVILTGLGGIIGGPIGAICGFVFFFISWIYSLTM